MAGQGLNPAAHSATAGGSLPWRLSRVRASTNPVGINPRILLLVPVAAGLLFLVLPLAALTARAISDQGIGGFVDVLGDELFVDAVRRTLALSLVVTIVCAVLGTAFALALVALPRAIALALLGVLLSAFWLSLLVRTFGWVLLFQPNGALDQFLNRIGLTSESLDLLQTTPAMYPAMVHVLLPFFVLPVYSACTRLDSDLLRAALSLGARPASVFRHVLLPQLRPAIFASATLVFLLSLAFYVTPLLIGGPSELTIATLIDREFNELYDLDSAATMAVILLVVTLLIYLVVDRFVRLIPTGDEG